MKKATGLISKTAPFKTLHVQHTFSYIPSPPRHDCDVKFPQATFYVGCTKLFFIPLNLCSVAKNSSPGKFTNIWHVTEPNRVILGVIWYIFFVLLFYKLLSGLGSLLRMFCFLCFTSAVSNTGDELNNRDKVWNKAKSCDLFAALQT